MNADQDQIDDAVADGQDDHNQIDDNPIDEHATASSTVDRRYGMFGGWERQRLIQFWVRVALVGVSTVIAIKVVQPSLVLKNSTPTGGDMGATSGALPICATTSCRGS